MAVTQNLMSLDAYFRSTPGDKLIVNDYSYFSKESDSVIDNALKTIYNNTDTLSTKPTCDCGELVGRYLVGKVCPSCGTECKEVFDKVYPVLWLRSLDPNYRFLNPTFWLMVSDAIHKIRELDVLRWLTDSRYNPNMLNLPDIMFAIRDNVLDGKRNYANTMSRLRAMLEYLATIPKHKNNQKGRKFRALLNMYDVYQDKLFSEYLPILNKKLFVVENTSKGKYVNIISADTVDVVKTWQKLCSQDKKTENLISSCTGNVLSKLAILYNNHYKKFIVAKTGLFRKNVYGAKSHFSFRCVAVSIAGQHRFDEIIAPWIVGLTTFRPHVLNKLIKRGMSYKDASKRIFKACNKFDQEIADILKELVAETPDGRGIACCIQRNPSLKAGSALLVYITKFREEVDNFTLGISTLIVKPMNADFDGTYKKLLNIQI